MSNTFYPKLAFNNLKKNGKTYIPYLFTCVVTVMMFYVMNAIARNEGIQDQSLHIILNWSAGITGIFSAVFLFYTNNFLIRQRKKEIGLYQVLGMDKGNITKMMIWETIYTILVSLILGLLSGILLGKLLFLILLKMLRFSVPLKFSLEVSALNQTVVLFTAIFIVTLLFNLLQVQKANPVELLKGGNRGEKEPKTKWIMTILGVITMAIGYYIAVTTESPLTAITKFFIAVILVIVGTYALFTAGSIAFLKVMKKNKTFYYNTKHFTAVSGMIYRMKQNAVGLANICLFSTIVLVLVSTTSSLYLGMEDILSVRYPTDFLITSNTTDENTKAALENLVDEELEAASATKERFMEYRGANVATVLVENELLTGATADMAYADDRVYGTALIPRSDYEEMEGERLSLGENEVAVYCPSRAFSYDTLRIGEQEFQVKKVLNQMKIEERNESYVIPNFYIILPDEQQINEILAAIPNETVIPQLKYYMQFDVEGPQEKRLAAMETMKTRIYDELPNVYCEYREASEDSFYRLYGGLLFLGIFVGLLFLMATVLIIYYKQISEGYEDKERYQIMQKVGMGKKEVKRSIRSQVLTVFFLPIVVAVIHVAVAFKVMTKLLAVLNLINVPLFFTCTVVTILVYTVFYVIVFGITAREYYRIVN